MRRLNSPERLPSYSIIISSGSQLYSGMGRVIFDWIKYAKNHFDFEIVIDAFHARNFNIARQFCQEHNIPCIVLRSANSPGAVDRELIGVDVYLNKRQPRYIELHSWGNIAVNTAVIETMATDSLVFFTPHTQPFSTIPEHHRFFMLDPGFRRIINEADLVFALSPPECRDLSRMTTGNDRIHLILNGVNTEIFKPATCERKTDSYVLSISDFGERRKRNDLMFRAFERVVESYGPIEFRLAGNDSKKVCLSNKLDGLVQRYGYVTEKELLDLYQHASVFVLLSDFEAFGIPIAEALCCGIPVVINSTEQMMSIFGNLPGVKFVQNHDTAAVAAAIMEAHKTPAAADLISKRAREAFHFDSVYGKKLQLVQRAQRNTQRIDYAPGEIFQ